jgi:hypothetical protein
MLPARPPMITKQHANSFVCSYGEPVFGHARYVRALRRAGTRLLSSLEVGGLPVDISPAPGNEAKPSNRAYARVGPPSTRAGR